MVLVGAGLGVSWSLAMCDVQKEGGRVGIGGAQIGSQETQS